MEMSRINADFGGFKIYDLKEKKWHTPWIQKLAIF